MVDNDDTEYLPTCGLSYVMGQDSRRNNMKVLTRNVMLFVECINDKCNGTGSMNIEELRDDGVPEECPECGDFVTISQECLIKN